MQERPKLIDHIDPFLRDEVKSFFPEEIISKYEEKMDAEVRLQHGAPLAIKPGYKETNLDHTVQGLDLILELERKSKYLPKEVNFRAVKYMFGLHDGGEIITKDAPPFGPEREGPYWKRRKRLEARAGSIFVLSCIPNQTVRDEMREYYLRAMRLDPWDKEAHLTKLIDSADGTTRSGTINYFNFRALGYKKPWQGLSNHVLESTKKFVKSAVNLHQILSPDSQSEIRQFTIEELARFEPIGFGRIARQRTQLFLELTNNKD